MNLKNINILIKVANELDSRGLYKAADLIDFILKSAMDMGYDDDESEDLESSVSIPSIVWRAGSISSNEIQGGVWFADKKEDGERFMKFLYNEDVESKPYSITLNNPKIYDRHWGNVPDPGAPRIAWVKKLKEQGYDGVVVGEDSWWDGADEESRITGMQFLVFDLKNIRSL